MMWEKGGPPPDQRACDPGDPGRSWPQGAGRTFLSLCLEGRLSVRALVQVDGQAWQRGTETVRRHLESRTGMKTSTFRI